MGSITITEYEISGVLFDLDNTLVDRDKAVRRLADQLFESVRDEIELDRSQFANVFVRTDASGSIPDKAAQMASLVEAVGIKNASATSLKKWWDETYPSVFELDNDTARILKQLDSFDVPWGIVTNGSPLQKNVIESVGLGGMTRAVIVSSLVDLRKPDPAIFKLGLSKLGAGVSPAESLFVGDNPVADIVGAGDVGMKTAWVSKGLGWQIEDYRPDLIVDSVGGLDHYISE